MKKGFITLSLLMNSFSFSCLAESLDNKCPNLSGKYFYSSGKSSLASCNSTGRFKQTGPMLPIWSEYGSAPIPDTVFEIRQTNCRQVSIVLAEAPIGQHVTREVSIVMSEMYHTHQDNDLTAPDFSNIQERTHWKSGKLVYESIQKSKIHTEGIVVSGTLKGNYSFGLTPTGDLSVKESTVEYGLIGPIPNLQNEKINCTFQKVSEDTPVDVR
ncbi:MAG: hypothetical protein ACXVCY_03420 [Pseudobdellovibrionaceae bacterium]